MGIIENIFYLCIVYILFNLIWGLIIILPKMALSGLSSNSSIDHAVKVIRYLIISTLTYSTCYNYTLNNSMSNTMIILVYISGGLFLSLYLVGKLNKRQSFFKLASSFTTNLKFGKNNFSIQQLTYEKHIAGISIVIFAACVGIPTFGDLMVKNPVNVWFLNTIDGIYKAPILKWIIGFAGTIFMLSMFQRGISTIQQLIGKISGEKPNNQNDNPLNKIMEEFQNMNNPNESFKQDNKEVDLEDDLYVDFEEMEDDEKKEK